MRVRPSASRIDVATSATENISAFISGEDGDESGTVNVTLASGPRHFSKDEKDFFTISPLHSARAKWQL